MFIGFIPSFNNIGLWAPALLILLRLIQGFSVGGEIPSATVFTLEHFKKKHAGLAVGIVFMSITLGNALASLLGFVLTHIFNHTKMLTWGWRIAFYCGFLLGIVSYFLRKKALETPVFQEIVTQQDIQKFPIAHLFKAFKVKLFICTGLVTIIAAGIFTFLYLPTYAVDFLHYKNNEIFLAATIFFTLTGILSPLFGFLSEYIGRTKQLIIGTLICIVVGFFLFDGLIHHATTMPWSFAVGMAIIFAINNSIYALTIAETFKASTRTSGLGFCYNTGFAVFGGLAPLLITLLINETHNVFLPYYYLFPRLRNSYINSCNIPISTQQQKITCKWEAWNLRYPCSWDNCIGCAT